MINSFLKVASAVLVADDVITNIQNQKLQKENPNAELKTSIADKACETILRGAGLLWWQLYDSIR